MLGFLDVMNISPINNINFKSKIKVLSPTDYERLINNMSINPNYQNIFDWNIELKPKEPESFRAYRVNTELASTENIKSCTGALFITPGEKINLVTHLLNSAENIKNLTKLEPYANGENAFIVGSKSEYDYSSELYKAVENMAKIKKMPITKLEDMDRYWEAHFACDALKDTIYLCVNEIINPDRYVKSLDTLKRVFKKVSISPKDTIEFISEQKTPNLDKLTGFLRKL